MLSIPYSNRIKLWKNGKAITKIKLFINNYNCEGINYPSENWKKKNEKNNLTTAFNECS